ncbi:thiopurine S-methyltransferase [Ectothiorhodospiraceae bacterium 2226]|nr:thiopurine S-methyltransferase [Ectothiorhodospiraceae bacterium 2226]
MDEQFWLERWESGQIGFHLDRPNPHLQRFAEHLELPRGSAVFVPLCGKTLDMVWLAQQGLAVIGVEWSEAALHAFFATQKLEPRRVREADLEAWRAGPYTLYRGDYFRLEPDQLAACHAFYDRAALIALPQGRRVAYVAHLHSLMPPRHRGLLISVEYAQTQMQGPPFSVPEAEARALYTPHWDVECLHAEDALAGNPRFAERGLDSFWEKVFLLRAREGKGNR